MLSIHNLRRLWWTLIILTCLLSTSSLKAHFGHDWMMLANPVYGSFDSAAYGHDSKLSDDEKRAKKRGALTPWPAKP
jgi:predicted secreted acid phosphatase